MILKVLNKIAMIMVFIAISLFVFIIFLFILRGLSFIEKPFVDFIYLSIGLILLFLLSGAIFSSVDKLQEQMKNKED